MWSVPGRSAQQTGDVRHHLGVRWLDPRDADSHVAGGIPVHKSREHRVEVLVLGEGLLDLWGGPAALRRLLVPQHERGMLAGSARNYPRPEVDCPGLAAGAHHQRGHRRRAPAVHSPGCLKDLASLADADIRWLRVGSLGKDHAWRHLKPLMGAALPHPPPMQAAVRGSKVEVSADLPTPLPAPSSGNGWQRARDVITAAPYLHGAPSSPNSVPLHHLTSPCTTCRQRRILQVPRGILTPFQDGIPLQPELWDYLEHKSPRREVVRLSAGAGVIYPPFGGSFA